MAHHWHRLLILLFLFLVFLTLGSLILFNISLNLYLCTFYLLMFSQVHSHFPLCLNYSLSTCLLFFFSWFLLFKFHHYRCTDILMLLDYLWSLSFSCTQQMIKSALSRGKGFFSVIKSVLTTALEAVESLVDRVDAVLNMSYTFLGT